MSRMGSIRGVRRAAVLASFTLTACWLSSSAAALTFTVQKTQTPAVPVVGFPIVYRIDVTNTGAEAITSLCLTDTISPVISSPVTDQPAAFGAPVVTSIAGSGTKFIWCSASLSMTTSMTYTFTITGIVAPTCFPAHVSNTAFVNASGAVTSGHVLSNPVGFTQAPPTTAITAVMRLTPAAPLIGSPMTYAIDVTNTGGATLSDFIVVDTISPLVMPPFTTDEPAAVGAPVITSVASGTRFVWSSASINFTPTQVLTLTITGICGSTGVPSAVSNTAYAYADGACAAIGVFTNNAVFAAMTAAIAPPGASTTIYAAPAGSILVSYLPATAGTYPISAYQVFRATCAACSYGQIGSAPSPATIYLDATPLPGSTYYFEVRAVDTMGVPGAFGRTVTGRATDPPGAPNSLTATASSVQIVLAWSAALAGTYPVSAYQVFQRINCTACAPTQTFTTTLTGYTDTTIGTIGWYYYQVQAIDTAGNVGPVGPTASALIGPVMSVWETSEPPTAKAGDTVDYRISFSNYGDTTAWSVVIATMAGSFHDRKSGGVPPPPSFFVEGGYGAITATWSRDAGTWFSTTDTGLPEPFYLRWIFSHVGSH